MAEETNKQTFEIDVELLNSLLQESEPTESSYAKNVAAAEAYPKSPEGIQDAQLESAEVAQAERSDAALSNVDYFGDVPIFSAMARIGAIGGTNLINETDKFFGISDGLKKYTGIDAQAGDGTFLADPKSIGLNARDIWESAGSVGIQFFTPFVGLPKLAIGATTLIPKIPGFYQGATKLTESLGLLKKSPNGKVFLDGALGSLPIDYALFNPDDPNVINAGFDTGFFERISFGVIANDSDLGMVLKKVLEQDPNDPEWMNRGRNATISFLAGGVASALFKTLKAAGTLVRGAKEELDEASVEYATNLLNEIEKIRLRDPKALKELDEVLPTDNLRAEHFTEPETAGEAIARVAKEGNEFHSTPSPKRDIKNPQYEVTPKEEKALLKIATDALEGRPIDITDTDLPINLTKIETAEQLKAVIHAVGKVIDKKLDRNLPMTDYASKAAQLVGRIGAKNVQKAAEQVDYSRGYVVASKLMTVNATRNHLKHLEKYLANPDDTVAQFNYNLSQIEMVESVNAAANLSTSGGRFLAEFKKVSKELTKDQQAALWKADILNKMIDSGKVTLKKAQRARKISDEAAFKSETTRAGDVDPTKVRKQRQKRPKDTSRKTERDKISKDIATKGRRADRSNEMQLQSMLAYSGKSRFVRTRDAALEVYINGLLSKPTTQIINMAGNTSTLATAVFERAWAGLRNSGNEGIQLKESYYLLSGMTEALTKDAWGIIKQAYKEGPSDLSIKTDMSRPWTRALSAEAFDGSPGWNKFLDWVGHKVNIPGRVLMSVDEAFKAINYRGEINALAFRKANQDVTDALGHLPKTDAEKAQVLEGYSKQFEIGGMSDEITEAAAGFSKKQTFTDQLKTLSQGRDGKLSLSSTSGFLKKAIESDPTGFLKFQFPFFQTPVNLIKYGAERTAIMRRLTPLMDELESTNPVTRQLAEAKVATGNLLTATGVMAGMNGLATGAPPTNYKLRAAYEAAGILPYHIWVPGFGYRPYSRLDPLGMSIANGANLAIFAKSMINITGQALEEGVNRRITEAYFDAFAQVAMGTVRLITDRTYLQTASVLTSAVDGDGSAMSKVFGNLHPNKTLFPYSSLRKGIMKGIDSNKPFNIGDPSVIEEGDTLSDLVFKEMSQEWDDFWSEAFRNHIPGWRDEDDFEPDIIGEPTFFPGGGSEEIHLTPSRMLNRSLEVARDVTNSLFNPFPEAVRSKSPLKTKIAELNIQALVPRNVKTIAGVDLTTEERKYWAKIYTDLNKGYESELLRKNFNTLPEGEQKAQIEARLHGHKNHATGLTKAEFPRIMRFASDDTFHKMTLRNTGVNNSPIQDLFNPNKTGQQ
jgi:hypothetical protein